MGKKGGLPAYGRANGFLLKPTLTLKVFGALAQRYADRPGGYTRIHKFGNRPGDNAPHAILELVDNPRDLRFEMTTRAIGWELLAKRVASEGTTVPITSGVGDILNVVEKETTLAPNVRGTLRAKTRWNLQKVLRYRPTSTVADVVRKAQDHAVCPMLFTPMIETHMIPQDTLIAQPLALKTMIEAKEANENAPLVGPKALRLKAGQKVPGWSRSALHIAQGALGKEASSSSRWFERRKLGVDTSIVIP